MGLLNGVLTEQATYWEFLGADDFGGLIIRKSCFDICKMGRYK